MKHPTLAAAALSGMLPLLSACDHVPIGRAALGETGYVSHQLCSAVFVAGQDPVRYYREAIEPLGGAFGFLLSHRVDLLRGEVRASFAGMAESRAVYRAQFGCVNATGTTLTGVPAAPARSPMPHRAPSAIPRSPRPSTMRSRSLHTDRCATPRRSS